jgi:hypothetical protein
MSTRDTLSREDLERAWGLAYRESLDELPDREIQWEADLWRTNDAEQIAAIGDALLAERRETETSIPGGAESAMLNLLMARINWRAASRMFGDEGICLVSAARLVYWNGLTEVPR